MHFNFFELGILASWVWAPCWSPLLFAKALRLYSFTSALICCLLFHGGFIEFKVVDFVHSTYPTRKRKEKKKVRKRNAIAQLNVSLFELSFLDEMISEPFVVYKLVRFYLVDTELLFKVCALVDCQWHLDLDYFFNCPTSIWELKILLKFNWDPSLILKVRCCISKWSRKLLGEVVRMLNIHHTSSSYVILALSGVKFAKFPELSTETLVPDNRIR